MQFFRVSSIREKVRGKIFFQGQRISTLGKFAFSKNSRNIKNRAGFKPEPDNAKKYRAK